MLRGNLPALLELLRLERIDAHLFLGRSPDGRDGRVYGGQVAAQAVLAATRTLADDWPIHSLHAYFLRPGDPRRPILFMVEPIRDGRSFATRRIVARQEGKAVFSMDASFQVRESGLTHQAPMPATRPPEALRTLRETFDELRIRHPERSAELADSTRPFDFRWDPDPFIDLESRAHPPSQICWFRLARALAPSEREGFEEVSARALHTALLVYASDHSILDTALRPHWDVFDWSRAQVASLDHAMWFHQDANVNEWILYAQDAPAAASGRGCSRGVLYARDGTLVASAMQESLMRLRPVEAGADTGPA